jgi:hypothetical protein
MRDKMFKTWKQFTCICKDHDTSYIKRKKKHVKCSHLVVRGFIPMSTVVVYVTAGKSILKSFLFLCSCLHKYCELIF